jgi:hypothetical protein
VAWHAAAVRDPLSAILFAVPNGEDRDMVTAALLSGTVDLILPLAPGSVGFRMGHPAHCCALLSPPPALRQAATAVGVAMLLPLPLVAQFGGPGTLVAASTDHHTAHTRELRLIGRSAGLSVERDRMYISRNERRCRHRGQACCQNKGGEDDPDGNGRMYHDFLLMPLRDACQQS